MIFIYPPAGVFPFVLNEILYVASTDRWSGFPDIETLEIGPGLIKGPVIASDNIKTVYVPFSIISTVNFDIEFPLRLGYFIPNTLNVILVLIDTEISFMFSRFCRMLSAAQSI